MDRFERAWQDGERPAVEAYLPADGPGRLPLLLELVHVELERRLQAGEPARVEEYLARFPELAANPSAGASLVRAEYHHRRLRDGAAAWDDYLRRFPQYEPQLRETWSAQEAPTQTGPPPAAGPAADPVFLIGRYRVIERLGGGGQAEVYRAVHPHIAGHDVVVKWASHALPADVQQLLVAEAGILARLEDPGLVRVYDADVCQGRPFLVMEYVPGRSLAQRLKQEGLPTPRESAGLVARLAETMARVHREGDLKPGNILIDSAGRPRVVDFGLALMESPATPDWTASGSAGTSK